MSEIKITYHPCQGWGCHERCIIEAHSRDGKLVRTQKATLPGPQHHNEICMKGVLNQRIPYAEDRILYPLKRVGERGEGKFERISWDQALDEICDKLNESIAKYGSRTILTNINFCGYPGSNFSLQTDLIYRFNFAMDCSLIEYPAVDFSMIWTPTIDAGLFWPTAHAPLRKAENAIIIWGQNPLGFTRSARTSRDLLNAQERGAKLIHVSNLFDTTSARCDEWVCVKSGTDAALALAMVHVVIEEGKVDRNFLLAGTSAPYLVRTDTGKYLRESDLVNGGADDSFVVVDRNDNTAFIPKQIGQNEATMAGFFGDFDPELEADLEINGIACKTVFSMLVEHVEKWTPEYQEDITGYPADKCVEFAHEIVDSTPVTFFLNCGLRYANSTQAFRAVMLLAYVTGNLGRYDGGTVVVAGLDEHPNSAMDPTPVMFPEGWSPDKSCRVTIPEMLESYQDPSKQQYKVIMNTMGNLLLNWPNKKMWKEDILPNIDLLVDWEIHMTDTCRWADYILPETTALERDEVLNGQADVIVYCEPAMEPLGEAKQPAWIWSEMAKRLGIGDAFTKTQAEWIETKVRLCSGDLKALTKDGYSEPITWERLKEEKVMALDLGPDRADYDPMRGPIYPTDTGRLEFYNELLAEADSGFADYDLPIIGRPEKELYPLQFFSGRHKYFMQGQFTNVPECLLLAKDQYGVALNPEEALKRGMVDGEIVEVFNQRGCMRVPLHLRNDTPMGMVRTWYSFDETYYPDTDSPQVLQEPMNTVEQRTPMMELWGPHFIQVGMLDKGMPPAMCFIGGNDTCEPLWDALCDIRKVEQ